MKNDAILYVEDDEDDVFFMQRAFKQVGVTHSLMVAHDGQEALDYLMGKGKYADRQQYPIPVLVLLDLKLPRKYGLDVLQWIRKHPAYHTMLVLVLTSSSKELDAHVAYGMGANAYLVKPPGTDALTDMVKAIRDFWLAQNTAPPECIKLAEQLVAEPDTGAEAAAPGQPAEPPLPHS